MCCALSHMVVYISLGISQKNFQLVHPVWQRGKVIGNQKERQYPFELKYLDKI